VEGTVPVRMAAFTVVLLGTRVVYLLLLLLSSQVGERMVSASLMMAAGTEAVVLVVPR